MELSARSAGARRLILLLAALASASCSSSNSGGPPESSASTKKIASERNDAVERLDKATRLVTDFRGSVPYEEARAVQCVVAVPSLMQGGLVFGGRGGRGFAICRNEGSDWGAPAPVSVSGGSFGAQVGVQSVDVMALLMTDKARQALFSGHFQVGVDASASAGTQGAGTNADFRLGSDVLSYARSQGLFAGATLSGATISRDDDATEALYGEIPDLRSLLESPRAPVGASAARFTAVVRDAFGPSARPLSLSRAGAP
jgi:lipid-binding SYLF domain-containing protein